MCVDLTGAFRVTELTTRGHYAVDEMENVHKQPKTNYILFWIAQISSAETLVSSVSFLSSDRLHPHPFIHKSDGGRWMASSRRTETAAHDVWVTTSTICFQWLFSDSHIDTHSPWTAVFNAQPLTQSSAGIKHGRFRLICGPVCHKRSTFIHPSNSSCLTQLNWLKKDTMWSLQLYAFK